MIQRRIGDIVLHLVVVLGFIASVYPIYWMFISATHTNEEILSGHHQLWFGSALAANFAALLSNTDVNIFRAIGNSLFISIVSTAIAVVLSAMAGYAFAIYRFRVSNFLFIVVIISLMIPAQVTLIPLFILMSHLHLINTWWAIILPALVNVFGVFLMRQAFSGFPEELLDAARMDGLTEGRIFWRIVMPLMRPTLSALAIIAFLASWTNLLWPLVVLNSASAYTIPVALSTLENSMTVPNYGEVMLAASIATIPMLVLFLFLRRNFVSGIMAGFNR
ncbi:MAG: carbohydrate ABC transporter permease [Alicyclobacillaceae bacterium]|uniref:carbohydrate ABC transporter permease n=1 Tax=Alicyclobacillus sp. SP_1 TaxID=2942475 RepID=UPI002158241A|nr:carbohydrate ABC transporter permease [Alicyclobacillus sp. SP_1]MCY0886889.1 carbohydrate ABC transporter permease [Alicyclobacillaceae bacterium]MCY0896483.1 carbohydrate ABC transporter permease [Alicyclobacillaceae bacterium]